MNIIEIDQDCDDIDCEYPLKILVGKIIVAVEINAEKNILKITEKHQDYYFYTKGGCCSTTWIEHLNTGLDEIDWEHDDTNIFSCLSSEEIRTVQNHKAQLIGQALGTKKECDKIYLEVLEGIQGAILEVDYRNSSNGYYGGSLIQIGKPDDVNFKPVERF